MDTAQSFRCEVYLGSDSAAAGACALCISECEQLRWRCRATLTHERDPSRIVKSKFAQGTFLFCHQPCPGAAEKHHHPLSKNTRRNCVNIYRFVREILGGRSVRLSEITALPL